MSWETSILVIQYMFSLVTFTVCESRCKTFLSITMMSLTMWSFQIQQKLSELHLLLYMAYNSLYHFELNLSTDCPTLTKQTLLGPRFLLPAPTIENQPTRMTNGGRKWRWKTRHRDNFERGSRGSCLYWTKSPGCLAHFVFIYLNMGASN